MANLGTLLTFYPRRRPSVMLFEPSTGSYSTPRNGYISGHIFVNGVQKGGVTVSLITPQNKQSRDGSSDYLGKYSFKNLNPDWKYGIVVWSQSEEFNSEIFTSITPAIS